MKNKLLIASLALLGFAGLSSCVADKEPELKTPTEFTLNTPAFADQLYIFDCDAAGNSLNDITLTWSQPNYGVAVTPTYTVQVAKTAEDFNTWDALQAAGEEQPEDQLPLTAMVDGSTTSAQWTISGEKFSTAVNTVYGLTLDNVKDQAHQVVVRVHAEINHAKNSAIWSNPITLAQVLTYIKPVADKVWLVGAPNSWNIAGDENWVLEENEIGSKVYEADFTIPEGQFMFRFYDETGNWDHFSIGSQVDDSPIDIEVNGQVISALPEEGVTLNCLQEVGGVNPKGSWNIPDWKGGKVHIILDLNENTVTFSPGQSKKIYLVGAPNGWNINGDSMSLVETEDGSNIFTGTYDIEAGQFQFRFYKVLGDWETNSIGSQVEDSPIEISVSGTLTVDCVDGKGSWQDPNWGGGSLTMTVDLNTYKVTFQKN